MSNFVIPLGRLLNCSSWIMDKNKTLCQPKNRKLRASLLGKGKTSFQREEETGTRIIKERKKKHELLILVRWCRQIFKEPYVAASAVALTSIKQQVTDDVQRCYAKTAITFSVRVSTVPPYDVCVNKKMQRGLMHHDILHSPLRTTNSSIYSAVNFGTKRLCNYPHSLPFEEQAHA